MDSVAREICRQSILAAGRTWPNPTVACVIVTERGTFAGATEPPGFRHAEIVALDLMDQTLGADSKKTTGVMFVTLEPCSTHGRTPPCVDRIKQYPGLTVHIANLDPSLRKAGIEALQASSLSVLQDRKIPGHEYLAGFISRCRGLGPRFHLKAATRALHTSQGALDSMQNDSMGSRLRRELISGADGLAFTQMLRAKLDAVLVGPGTIVIDLPGLTFRPLVRGRSDLAFESSGSTETQSMFQGRNGQDIWLDSLLENQTDCLRIANDPAFQPARVFLLDRVFENSAAWFKKQAALEKETGRSSIYFDLTEDRIWSAQGAKPLPRMSHPEFTMALRMELGVCGFNEVLIEGGAGLFRAIQHKLTPEDRILLVRNKEARNESATRTQEENPKDDNVMLPEFMLSARRVAEYAGRTDDLIVAAPI